MTARRWLVVLSANAALAGWSIGTGHVASSLAVVVVQVFAIMVLPDEVDTTVTLANRRAGQATDLLAEVLEEHGPIYCDPTCDCSACRSARWLANTDPARFTDAPWWTRG